MVIIKRIYYWVFKTRNIFSKQSPAASYKHAVWIEGPETHQGSRFIECYVDDALTLVANTVQH